MSTYTDGTQGLKKQTVKYIARVMVQRMLGLVCFLTAAGTISDARGWVYFSLYFVISIITLVAMFFSRAETLVERGKKHGNTKKWDKICLSIYVPASFYLIYIAAGLDIRFERSFPSTIFSYIGFVLYLISTVTAIWPIMENKHFESTARIQNDRQQTVVTTGPYRLVRHPGYFAIVIWACAVPMIFGSLSAGVVSAVILLIIAIRTYFEDTMLKNELPGYREYASEVKYRLIPFIW